MNFHSSSSSSYECDDHILPIDYQFVRKLGTGSQGTVYLVKDPDGNEVAIKGYPEEDLNVVTIEIVGLKLNGMYIRHFDEIYHRPSNTNRWTWIVMKAGYCNASSWAAKQPTSVGLICFVWNIMDQLIALKARGIIHCDLKLENIVFTQKPFRGRYFHLVDYGLAEFSGAKSVGKFQARYTGYCRSPDLRESKRNPEFRDDLYAFGASLLSMVFTIYDVPQEDFPVLHRAFRHIPYDECVFLVERHEITPGTFLKYGVPPMIDQIIYSTFCQNFPTTSEFISRSLKKRGPTSDLSEMVKRVEPRVKLVHDQEICYMEESSKIRVWTLMLITDVSQRCDIPLGIITAFTIIFIQDWYVLLRADNPQLYKISCLIRDCIASDAWYHKIWDYPEFRLDCSRVDHYLKAMHTSSFHELDIEEQMEIIAGEDSLLEVLREKNEWSNAEEEKIPSWDFLGINGPQIQDLIQN